jgi:hypothetical protein
MARARRRKQGQVDAGEGKVLVRAIIDVCPICQATPDTFAFPDDIAAHLQACAVRQVSVLPGEAGCLEGR